MKLMRGLSRNPEDPERDRLIREAWYSTSER